MLIDKRNGKKYVGKHNGKKDDYWSSGLVPNRIANKHGRDIFTRVILEDGIDDEELNNKEIYYIKLEDSFNNGYNSTLGGEGGNHWVNDKTEEEIKLIREKQSKKLKGRVFTDETKRKMSESAKNKVLTKEHRENIGKAVKKRGGTPHTDETKVKLSKAMTGKKNPKHSDFMVKNNPKSQKVSIDGVIYDTIKEASEELKINRSTIKYRLNNKKNKTWFKIN
jgi:group I intron endonuclease